MTRKLFSLVSMIAIMALLLTACGGAAPAKTNKVEMFSWWTAGGEADGLNAMYDHVQESSIPSVEIVNATVAGGAGTNAKAVLSTRLTGGDPPDSFQLHAGLEVEKYDPTSISSRSTASTHPRAGTRSSPKT